MIRVAVRWYLRYGRSYRDVEELLTEGSIEVDHVTIDVSPLLRLSSAFSELALAM